MMEPNCCLSDAELEARWPPAEELVVAAVGPGAAAFTVPVCWDLEATGRFAGSRILQLAAFQPRARPNVFSRFVLPPPGVAMQEGAAEVTGLELLEDAAGRRLHDVRANCTLPTVSEEAAVRDFVAWLTALAKACGASKSGAGVVLISHGALLLDVPRLVAAVRNAGLEGPFYKVVVGFGDSQAVFQPKVATAGVPPSEFMKLGLDALYKQVVGKERGGMHRADVDALHLHELLCAHLRKEELSLRLPELAACAYSARCMRRLVAWRTQWFDPHMSELQKIGCMWPRYHRGSARSNNARPYKGPVHARPWKGSGHARPNKWPGKGPGHARPNNTLPCKGSGHARPNTQPCKGSGHARPNTQPCKGSGRAHPNQDQDSSRRRPNKGPGSTEYIRKRNQTVKNLLCSGYDMATLHTDWHEGGLSLIVQRISRMKELRESYITDTSSLSAQEVGKHVAAYFHRVALQERNGARRVNYGYTRVAKLDRRGRKAPPTSCPHPPCPTTAPEPLQSDPPSLPFPATTFYVRSFS